MLRQPFVSFELAGVNLTSFGLSIPSPFCSLTISNAQISSFLSWELKVTVVGDDRKRSNIAAFEALLYSAAQNASRYPNSSGIPVSFMFGWLDDRLGGVDSYISYQGWTLRYNARTTGRFMTYTLTGYASQILRTNMPVLNIPALTGFVKPSA
jgi:hypothetical protein